MRRAIALTFVAVLLGSSIARSEQNMPVAVSPGSGDGVELVASTCTTFSWTTMEAVQGFTLAVYEVTDEGQLGNPIIRRALPAGATSWTMPAGTCLARGRTYAWVVGAVQQDGGTQWSRPVVFKVTPEPTEAELRKALAVVRSYLESTSKGAEHVIARVQEDAGERERAQFLEESAEIAPAPTYFSVDGNVDAISFSGDGSQLTAVTAAGFSGSLSGDVTGTQSATTVAAIQGNPVSSTAPAGGQALRYNSTSSEWEPGAVILSSSAAVSGILPLTSGGTGASDAGGALTNLGAAASQHLHTEADITDLVHTQDTVLTEGQVETYVTNGPLDGTSFTNVTAVAGDSATGFFSTGRIEETRISDEIARDDEVIAAFNRLWGRGREGAIVYAEAGSEPPTLCTNGGVSFGLSKMTVDWGSAADACPAGSWVCTLSDRGSAVCDTARPDLEEQRSCAGVSSDLAANAHRGWVDDVYLSESPEGRYVNEQGATGGVLSCINFPVWCCSE
jgi:hypothetical protein